MELNDAGAGAHVPAAWATQVDGGLHRPAGSHQIIEHHDALSRDDGIFLDLYGVGSVFEVIGVAHGWARQLALLADHRKTALEFEGERRRNQKPARFDADQKIWLVGLERPGEALHSRTPSARMCKQGRDIVEQNAGLWEIGDRADVLLEVHHRFP